MVNLMTKHVVSKISLLRFAVGRSIEELLNNVEESLQVKVAISSGSLLQWMKTLT
jgi:hypothetical protein